MYNDGSIFAIVISSTPKVRKTFAYFFTIVIIVIFLTPETTVTAAGFVTVAIVVVETAPDISLAAANHIPDGDHRHLRARQRLLRPGKSGI